MSITVIIISGLVCLIGGLCYLLKRAYTENNKLEATNERLKADLLISKGYTEIASKPVSTESAYAGLRTPETDEATK